MGMNYSLNTLSIIRKMRFSFSKILCGRVCASRIRLFFRRATFTDNELSHLLPKQMASIVGSFSHWKFLFYFFSNFFEFKLMVFFTTTDQAVQINVHFLFKVCRPIEGSRFFYFLFFFLLCWLDRQFTAFNVDFPFGEGPSSEYLRVSLEKMNSWLILWFLVLSFGNIEFDLRACCFDFLYFFQLHFRSAVETVKGQFVSLEMLRRGVAVVNKLEPKCGLHLQINLTIYRIRSIDSL